MGGPPPWGTLGGASRMARIRRRMRRSAAVLGGRTWSGLHGEHSFLLGMVPRGETG